MSDYPVHEKFNAVENFLNEQYEAGEIHVNDGDCDLLAADFVNAVDALLPGDAQNPDKVREAIKRQAYQLATDGMLGEPEIHPAIAELVLKQR